MCEKHEGWQKEPIYNLFNKKAPPFRAGSMLAKIEIPLLDAHMDDPRSGPMVLTFIAHSKNGFSASVNLSGPNSRTSIIFDSEDEARCWLDKHQNTNNYYLTKVILSPVKLYRGNNG